MELIIQPGGEIALPADIRQRYGLTPNTTVRVIETRSGVLLVPLTDQPMTPDLRDELEQWSALGSESWDMFPYEDGTP